MRKILVTGVAGFIGHHLIQALQREDVHIIGVDNINDYYDVNLKFARLQQQGISRESIFWERECQSSYYDNYQFIRSDLSLADSVNAIFERNEIEMIIHLAAQAGVRYSLINPKAYVDSNLTAFVNIIENCRNHSIQKFIYASSSSVYGHAERVPFTENMNTDKPISLYAATKKSNELMACTYSHLFGINSIGLRFFTVYGPWGRPDMAPMLFAKAAMNGESIKIFNHGNQSRDFTYITDIISGIMACYRLTLVGGEAKIYNIGQGRPTGLLKFIQLLEQSLSRVTLKNFVPAQPGDVTMTFADVAALKEATGYNPAVGIEEGIEQFSKWYVEYYGS